MQDSSMPNCSSNVSLQRLSTSDDLGEIAMYLWHQLLGQLQARKPNCRKGPKSWDIEVTKDDVLKVRATSRKEFWRKAQRCSQNCVLSTTNKSGSMLFWIALNSLMGGDRPRVKVEDNQLLGRPNSHGANFECPSTCPILHFQCVVTILHMLGRLLRTVVATYVMCRAIPIEGVSDIVLCMPPP